MQSPQYPYEHAGPSSFHTVYPSQLPPSIKHGQGQTYEFAPYPASPTSMPPPLARVNGTHINQHNMYAEGIASRRIDDTLEPSSFQYGTDLRSQYDPYPISPVDFTSHQTSQVSGPGESTSMPLPWQVTALRHQQASVSMATPVHQMHQSHAISQPTSQHSDVSSTSISPQPGRSLSPPPRQQWVIASRPPSNPMDAYPIIISPDAYPPPHIVSGAISTLSLLPKSSRHTPLIYPTTASKDTVRDPCHLSASTITASLLSSTTESNSACSSAPETPTPGSPLSSNTSLSSSLLELSASTKGSNDGDVISSSATPRTSPELPVLEAGQASVAKKSWASLLKEADSSSSITRKNSLPTSTMVGFSIPANSLTYSVPAVSSTKQPGLLALLVKGPDASVSAPRIRPRGLVNTGNICFANVVLQVLVYCTPFYHLFDRLGRALALPAAAENNADGRFPLIKAVVQFLQEFRLKNDNESGNSASEEDDWLDSFIPTYVYDALKDKRRFENLRGGQQEDAEEFLGFFLDTIEEELLLMKTSLTLNSDKEAIVTTSANGEGDSSQGDGWVEVGKKNKLVNSRISKSIESPITRIFGGKFRSTLKVPGQRDSVLMEDWRALQLDIQREQVNTIEDALRCISFPQAVQVSSVTKGGAIVDASQQVLVEALPEILVLHLKRFLYDTTSQGVKKINKHIEYRPQLEIPQDTLTPARHSSLPLRYKLFAVLYHHGLSAGGGHYTLDVLHPNRSVNASGVLREGWIRIDDELVSDLRAEDVFEANLDDRSAYLLFYKRVGVAWRP